MEFFITQYLATFSTLGLGYFLFLIAFSKDMTMMMTNDVHAINESAKTYQTEAHILKQIIELIDMHTDVKELRVK